MRATGRNWEIWIVLLVTAILALPARGQELSLLRLTLKQGITLALERNETLQMARQELSKARQQIREARAAALPQIDFSTNYTRNWQLPTFIFDTPLGQQKVTIGTRHDLVNILSLRQALYTSGKVGAALKVAHLFEDFSTEQLRTERQRVRSAVEIAFSDLLLAAEMLRVSDQALVRARANLEQVESLRRGGRVADYDLLRAQVQVAEMRPDSIAARNGLELARMNLKNLLGIDLERPLRIEADFRTETRLDLHQVEDLVQQGMERRPELRQATHQVEMLAQAIRITGSASRPSLDMNSRGQLQLQSEEFDLWNQEDRRSLSTGLSLQIPLFDGFRTGALVEQAKLDESRGQLALEQLRRSVELQIRQAWLSLRETDARLDAHRDMLAQAEEGLRLATSRYQQGFATYLEVLDAQLMLTRAQTERERDRRDRAVALVQLEAAVGISGESTEGTSQ